MRRFNADKFEVSGLEGLKSAGCDVSYQAGLKDDALAKAWRPSAGCSRVRSTTVPEAVSRRSAQTVVRAGAGYNTIDGPPRRAAEFMSPIAPAEFDPVAELAFGLILSLDRRIPDNVISLRQGKME